MKAGSVRIIGGKWRSRKLKVHAVEGLRPTPDRVRETVFNWLAAYIPGAYCLDLFAGTGALGFEALSRGAQYVEMVDKSPQVIKLLKEQLHLLAGEDAMVNASIYQAIVPNTINTPTHPFDIVFLDPPYKEKLLFSTCLYLEEKNFLADIAYIYLEADAQIKDNELPNRWKLIKAKQNGQVFYHLAKREKE